MVWFTSDWHLGHANIMKYCKRPFKTVEEMNKTILDNFFEVVKKGDKVYFLGDFSFTKDAIFELNNKRLTQGIDITFIKGNHDKALFDVAYSLKLHLCDLLSLDINGQSVTLCHYPMLTFNKSHYGAWQLYGHHHSGNYHKDIPPAVMGKKMNVGVDVNDFKPVSWDQVKAFMAKQPDNFDLLKQEERH